MMNQPQYIGFSTQEVDMPRTVVTTGVDGGVGTTTQQPYISKKFRLTDEQLVIRDFINSLNIKQGDKVGNPSYGTLLWTFIYEQQGDLLNNSVRDEISRMASLDPRLTLNDVAVYTHENGILVEIQLSVTPFENVTQLGLFVNPSTGQVQQMIMG